jgi:arylsulfatase A-like enzyme
MAEVLRDSGYRTAVIGKWGLGQPGTTGQPDKQGFDYAFGFLDHRHAHRQFTDHLWRNGEQVRTDLDRDYVNDLFTREAAAFIERSDTRPFFVYLNYTVPHAELRVPDDSLEPFRGKFTERPFANPTADGTPTGARPDGPSLGYRSQPQPHAAFAAMITRMDRDVGRLVDLLGQRGHRSPDAGAVHQRQRSPSGRRRRSGVLQERRRTPRHQAGPLRGWYRVPMIARWTGRRPGGTRQQPRVGALGCLADGGSGSGARVPAGLDGISMAAALRGESQRRTRSSTGSSTSAGFSRPSGWIAGRRYG